MCNKERYDKKSALSALNHCRKERGKKYRNECRIYYCELCNAHHLTSMEEYNEREIIPLDELIYKDEWLKLKGEVD